MIGTEIKRSIALFDQPPKLHVEKMPTGALTFGKHVITGTAQPFEKRRDDDL